MRALRENFVPVAFLALWVGVSGYTIHALGGMPTTRVIHASMDVTVTPPPSQTAMHANCPETQVL
jgi:hypothetical protein